MKIMEKGNIRNTIATVQDGVRTIGILVGNYRLLFDLALYWDELSKLDWWLLWSDEAFEMESLVDSQFEKYWELSEFVRFSNRHAELLDAFLGHCMQGLPRPTRPI